MEPIQSFCSSASRSRPVAGVLVAGLMALAAASCSDATQTPDGTNFLGPGHGAQPTLDGETIQEYAADLPYEVDIEKNRLIPEGMHMRPGVKTVHIPPEAAGGVEFRGEKNEAIVTGRAADQLERQHADAKDIFAGPNFNYQIIRVEERGGHKVVSYRRYTLMQVIWGDFDIERTVRIVPEMDDTKSHRDGSMPAKNTSNLVNKTWSIGGKLKATQNSPNTTRQASLDATAKVNVKVPVTLKINISGRIPGELSGYWFKSDDGHWGSGNRPGYYDWQWCMNNGGVAQPWDKSELLFCAHKFEVSATIEPTVTVTTKAKAKAKIEATYEDSWDVPGDPQIRTGTGIVVVPDFSIIYGGRATLKGKAKAKAKLSNLGITVPVGFKYNAGNFSEIWDPDFQDPKLTKDVKASATATAVAYAGPRVRIELAIGDDDIAAVKGPAIRAPGYGRAKYKFKPEKTKNCFVVDAGVRYSIRKYLSLIAADSKSTEFVFYDGGKTGPSYMPLFKKSWDLCPAEAMRVELSWKDDADFDLIVKPPNGDTLTAQSAKGKGGGEVGQSNCAGGGDLVGKHGNCDHADGRPRRETAKWPNTQPPSGEYTVKVKHVSRSDDDFKDSAEFDLKVPSPKGTKLDKSNVSLSQGQSKEYTFDYNP